MVLGVRQNAFSLQRDSAVTMGRDGSSEKQPQTLPLLFLSCGVDISLPTSTEWDIIYRSCLVEGIKINQVHPMLFGYDGAF